MSDRSSRRRELHDAAWLALVPAGVALVFGLLLVPRAPTPDGIPIPVADPRALALVTATDHTRADVARRQPLSGPVRALGSAIRDFHTLEAADADARALGIARHAVDAALIDALQGGEDGLLSLRAVQLEAFLAEVERFEATGRESDELHALAGAFVRSMRNDGWAEGTRLLPGTTELRVMYKQMWNAFLGLDGRKGFAPTLDEERAAYAFYLSHAHPSKAMREAIASARRGARDAKSCQALVEAETSAVESWRLERIARFAAIDPTYPADFARGVARYRRGEYRASAGAFRKWLEEHPEGPLALRAQNYLRAASDAEPIP